MPKSEVILCDCLSYLRGCEDNQFDLAIVDPPYQLGDKTPHRGAGKLKSRILLQEARKFESWDVAPPKEYFDELFRVTKNQIIWGGNYFPLPPTRCVVVWDKVQPWENFSQVEIAWTSFDYPAKLFTFDNRTGDKHHPCQKPVELYAYLLKTFAKEGDTILDTHLGSGTSRVAAYKLGYDFTGIELDEDYFNKSIEFFHEECLGEHKTKSGKTVIEQTLF